MDKAKDGAAEKIFSRVLKDIKPNDAEVRKTTEMVNKLTLILKKVVPKDVELRVAGSIARGTNLRGNADIDIFLLFSKGTSRERIAKEGLEYGKRAAHAARGRYEIKYAEHPYVRLYLDSIGVRADLVPASKISNIEDMATTVDRTPLHTDFINKSLNSKQRDHVRLLKHLLKAHSIYGAEVKTGGFSGYLCELLIHNYGSLPSFLENAAKYRMPIVIDPRSRKEIKDPTINKRFNSDFVVVDPVDKDRNVAAGVSKESLSRLVIIAREFASNPGKDLFKNYVNELQHHGDYESFLRQSKLDSFIVEARISNKSDDVVFPQLRKMSSIIMEFAERSGFSIYVAMPHINAGKGYMLFLTPKMELKTRLIKGPDAFISDAANNFIKSHKAGYGFMIRGSTIYALDRNRHENVYDLLQKVVKGKVVKDGPDVKVKSSKIYVNKIPNSARKTITAELDKRLLL